LKQRISVEQSWKQDMTRFSRKNMSCISGKSPLNQLVLSVPTTTTAAASAAAAEAAFTTTTAAASEVAFIATAETAFTTAATTTAATTASTEATATATAGSSTALALLLRPGLVDIQCPSLQILAVQAFDSGLPRFFGRHFDKSESLGSAAVFIDDDGYRVNLAEFTKCLPQVIFLYFV
jgi:hypothetical protein